MDLAERAAAEAARKAQVCISPEIEWFTLLLLHGEGVTLLDSFHAIPRKARQQSKALCLGSRRGGNVFPQFLCDKFLG